MRADELPIYPTPQQATYIVPSHSAQPQQRRTQKPPHTSSSAPPSNNAYSSPSSGAYNYSNMPPQNHYPPSHHNPSVSSHHQQPPQQYYQPPPQQQQQQQQQQPQQPQHHQPPRVTSSSSHYSNNYQGSPHGQQYQHPSHSGAPSQYYQNSPQYQNTPSTPQYSTSPAVNNIPQQQQQQQQQQAVRFEPSSQAHSPSHPTSQHTNIPQSVSSSHLRHNPAKKPPAGNTMSKEALAEQTKLANKQRLEAELRATFDRVDKDRSGRISAPELSAALINFDNTGFQNSTVRLMIKLFTTSNSSSAAGLNFEQFVSLWKYLTAYKKLFVAADVNKSGDISFGEFQRIIEQIGYKLNVDLVLFLFSKFSNKESLDNGSMAVGKLKFDSFIELLVYLRKLTDIFKQYDKELTGVATIDYSDFLFEISNLT